MQSYHSTAPRSAVLLVIALAFNSCAGILLVEQDKDHQPLDQIEKMVSIDPEFTLDSGGKKEDKTFLEADKKEKMFTREIVATAARLDVDVQVFDKETITADQVEFYNDLQPLRYQMLNSVFTQEVTSELNSKSKGFFSSAFQPDTYDFAEPPMVSPAFSYLAEQYGTPYFTVQGIYSERKRNNVAMAIAATILYPPLGIALLAGPKTNTFYYQVITDVRTGRIVHREVRISPSSINRENIRLLLYDSFNVFLKAK